jgi:hypothetical protein
MRVQHYLLKKHLFLTIGLEQIHQVQLGAVLGRLMEQIMSVQQAFPCQRRQT